MKKNDLNLEDNTLLIEENDFLKISFGKCLYDFYSDETLVVIGDKFIEIILNNENYYMDIERILNNNDPNLYLCSIVTDTSLCENPIPCYWEGYNKKIHFCRAFEAFIKEDGYSKTQKEKCEHLLDCFYNSFIEEENKNVYNCIVDNEEFKADIYKFNEIIRLSNEQFDNVCFNDEYKIINGLPREIFFYMLIDYFKDIEKRTVLPNKINDRINKLKTYQLVDFQSINKYIETTDTLHKKVVLNKELKEMILSGIPDDYNQLEKAIDYNQLEKAIYIYIKMCSLLSYDEDYFVIDQHEKSSKKHADVDWIKNITLENNKVVCFEFNIIYAAFLSELGINFKCNYKEGNESFYGIGHASLEFRWEKFLIAADSTLGILNGDLVNAKLNNPLNGLTCLNKSAKTKDEFNKLVEKAYNLIKQQRKNINTDRNHTLDDFLVEYQRCTNNIKPVSLEEKMDIFLKRFILLIWLI